MSLPDPYRGYAIGASTNGLNAAREGLHSAFLALMQHEDLDSELMSTISRAQTEVKAAQRLLSSWSWHAPALSRIRGDRNA